ncbi:hypothetical protein TIFTF001_023648 [Ficus carica]|uniref:Uncharacterized protein n=1 Tax=Ficus carica TaxID=3494 RepID=A0AA88DCM4_FICCA|nr:hypothetical protein TIFTF001_023648 [Ficus carica]
MKRRLKRSRRWEIVTVYSSFACRCKAFDQLRRLLRLEEIKDYGLNQKDESVAELVYVSSKVGKLERIRVVELRPEVLHLTSRSCKGLAIF